MKVLDALKANKEPVLMMLGTAGVVADVILSIRNGVRMKRKHLLYRYLFTREKTKRPVKYHESQCLLFA